VQILYSSKFEKQYRKLPESIKDLAEEKEQIFRNNQFDIFLKTHKLHGKLAGYYSFSINNKYRIIFSYDNKDIVRFHYIGTHDIY
jgi:addiction module RelE/StbE family toxin